MNIVAGTLLMSTDNVESVIKTGVIEDDLPSNKRGDISNIEIEQKIIKFQK